MGSGKPQEDVESEGKKWAIAGICVRAPLKAINTINSVDQKEKEKEKLENDEKLGDEEMTPTGEKGKIPTMLTCPPAPRKPKPKPCLNSNYGSVRDFFTPPPLETVFIRRHVDKA